MFAFAIPSLGDYMRMLAKQQYIFDCVSFSRGDNTLLQRIRLGVSDETEIESEARSHPHARR
jgi:hypothetical protein